MGLPVINRADSLDRVRILSSIHSMLLYLTSSVHNEGRDDKCGKTARLLNGMDRVCSLDNPPPWPRVDGIEVILLCGRYRLYVRKGAYFEVNQTVDLCTRDCWQVKFVHH